MKYIVTTSIYEPSEATLMYAAMKEWTLIVVGDKKTPHEAYENINCLYLSPDYQEVWYPELSEAIGWNKVMRRNIGFVHAYKLGATEVATVDDDNIPYELFWEMGARLTGRLKLPVDVYNTEKGIFDPLSVTNYKELWHRGYPLELVKSNKLIYKGVQNRAFKIQAGLWDGDPDVDAVCRKIYNPKDLKLEISGRYTTDDYTPFNSQNTTLHRDVLPYYMVLPHVGRMDDIWGGYICQYLTGERPVFIAPNVFQKRNEQSIKKNLQDEVLGYTDTLNFVQNIENYEELLPPDATHAFRVYRKQYAN